LLLVEPGAHAVSDQRRRILNVAFFEFIDDKLKDVAGRATRRAAFDGAAMDIQCHRVALLLLVVGPSQDRQPRLMAGVTLVISNVIIADEIACLEFYITFTAIHHWFVLALR